MLKIQKNRVPILSVDPSPDSATIDQASAVANLPFVVGHVALMGDTHLGYGFPIGTVAAFDKVVSPYAVGNDIGCGMIAARLNGVTEEMLRAKDKGNGTVLQKVGGSIMRSIPLGNSRRGKSLDVNELVSLTDGDEELYPVTFDNLDLIGSQLGTLGGGNHFMEIQVEDKDGSVWVMVHSGSRGLGGKICAEYYSKAAEMCSKWHTGVPKELSFFPIEDDLGVKYMHEHDFALRFAEENRAILLRETVKAICDSIGQEVRIDEDSVVQTHHNFFALEHHFGRNLYVHRKGAVRARNGHKVTIPGSMSTASYIAMGLGNPAMMDSCSHGAGRVLSRKKAKADLKVDDMVADLKKKEIFLFTPDKSSVLDEWGPAYKDVHQVMEWQRDMVTPIHMLRPIAVIKG